MKKARKFTAILLAAVLAAGMAACSQKNGGESPQGGGGKEIEVSFPSYLTGENVGAKFFLPQVERFNKKYAGKYKLKVEEVPQASYADKIKQLAQQKKLPVLIHSPGSGGIDVQWFRNVAVINNMCYDLTKFLGDNPTVKGLVLDDSLQYCTVDGKVVCMPLITIRPMGLFYNSEMYQPSKPVHSMTMDEFIKSVGTNKFAFQTADNGWTTSLLLTAFIANENGGGRLLQEHAETKLYDYTAPAIVDSVKKIQALMKTNAASNSIGAAYADAANSFMSKGAAIICNGPWMSSEFSSDSSGKWSNGFSGANVEADLYPGGIGLVNVRGYGDFWVSNTATDEEKDLACAFLAFRYSPDEVEAYQLAEGGSAPKLKASSSYQKELKKTKVLADLDEAATSGAIYVPNILDDMPSSVADSEFGKLLPKLADGTLTAEQFCQQLSEKAAETKS